MLRFAHDLEVPPTSNQAERDLRPSKIQQKISGRLTSEITPKIATPSAATSPPAIKHGIDVLTAIRDALTGKPWQPPLPAPT